MSTPNRGRRVGIRDVAAAAGVSATTVSHALNDKGRLPESTRELVRETARRLGYRPNPSAQRLGGGRTGLLGLTIAHPGSRPPAAITDVAYFVQLLSAASTTALNGGYALVLSANGPRCDESWRHTPLDGAVVVDPISGDPTVPNLRADGIPVVTTGRVPGSSPTDPYVDNDHVSGATRLLAHLQRAGAERIAFLSPPPLTSYAESLHNAYHAWCAQRGLPAQMVVVGDDFDVGAGYAAASEIIQHHPPNAILGATDRLALGASLAARSHGLRVPDDMLIAAYTDSESNLRADPTITALQLHPDQIGQQAIELLIDLIEGAGPREQQILIPSRLVARSSTRRRSG